MDKKEQHRLAQQKWRDSHKHKCLDCERLISPRGQRCYWCSNRHTLRHPKVLKGSESPRWKGGRHLSSSGYILILDSNHPNANHQGHVLEHRLVLEQKLGRLLKKGEIVHHLNGIRTDNRPCNLIAMSNKKHSLVLQAKAKRIQELEAIITNQRQLL